MKNRAFTFIEFLVVLGVIAFLTRIFLRALASTAGSTLRTQCLNNLRQLGIGTTVCANDNNGFFVPAWPSGSSQGKPPFVQYAISTYYTNELNAAGIPLVSNAPSIWCCPDIPELPCPDAPPLDWIIGYQYLGGINQWTPSGQTGVIPGTHGPVKLTQSRPYWCLAADLVAKINGTWGGTYSLDTDPPVQASMKTWPPHREGTNAIPVGGNEVFVDGSASWCTVQTMHNFTCWTSANEMWFYQSEADFIFGSVVFYNGPIYRWTGNN